MPRQISSTIGAALADETCEVAREVASRGYRTATVVSASATSERMDSPSLRRRHARESIDDDVGAQAASL